MGDNHSTFNQQVTRIFAALHRAHPATTNIKISVAHGGVLEGSQEEIETMAALCRGTILWLYQNEIISGEVNANGYMPDAQLTARGYSIARKQDRTNGIYVGAAAERAVDANDARELAIIGERIVSAIL
ncbi:hypothetical protein CCR94_10290 [Rhodoblastus sphagnicola]|uniref:Uncharacterized protein n=1 Tax=Rhodoblastus sphagnicola TaxID=333368 RepID=A0A2S6N930_9HYPH|nr:hypothetical protein [Rhodoblastus sphagnicola]MBB4196879.1 hypothetical protein [Rhodoblastus sphagnicola]PPQ31101.1 hypothetical protein CCR94_10290 [Rhodoblastus sphagnicola]